MEIGKPGSSFAFEIASRIGLPEDVLENAKKRVGTDHINFDKHLREALRDKRYWEQKRDHIRLTGKKLDEVLEKYESEIEQARKLRKEIIEKAKAEASQLIDGVNKKIENTIREIREVQAEKEKTKLLRKDLQEFSEQSLQQVSEEDDRISRQMDRIRQQKERKQKRKEEQKENQEKSGIPVENKTAEEDPHVFKTGDKVKMINQNTIGEVLDVNGRSILVAFGNISTTLDERRLVKVSEKEWKRQEQDSPRQGVSTALNERRLAFKKDIDVRGMRTEEALLKIQQFLDEALMYGFGDLRILHGKGNGILRQMIRDYLRSLDFVESATDAHVDFGGAGITVVKLGF